MSAVPHGDTERVESEDDAGQLQVTFAVTRNESYDDIIIDVSGERFRELGFDYGDSLDLLFSNGYGIRDVAFYNGFYCKAGEVVILDYQGGDHLWGSVNYGDGLWDIAGLGEGDTLTISLNEKGKYADIQDARDISYTNKRDDYASDEEFANFREVIAGAIAPDVLFRSASMCSERYGRASYVDGLSEASGIACVIDLADDLEEVEKNRADENYHSLYFDRLLDDGRVVPVSVDANFLSDAFHSKVAQGLVRGMELPTPWLVFCTEGKDRTGFVSMVLEALAEATYEEVESDYMTTYANYYGITKESDPERYDVIVRELLHPMIAALFDREEVDVTSVDLEQGARNYLAKGGMTDAQIERLKGILTGVVEMA